jgi:hypothetical protein
MTKSKKTSVDRRGFLKGAAGGAAALVSDPIVGRAQQAATEPARRGAVAPTEAALARESGNSRPALNVEVIEKPQSDYMVDVIKRWVLSTSPSTPDRASRACMSRSSTTATTSPRS